MNPAALPYVIEMDHEKCVSGPEGWVNPFTSILDAREQQEQARQQIGHALRGGQLRSGLQRGRPALRPCLPQSTATEIDRKKYQKIQGC